ncbi:NB-ARC domain-containing protein [Rivularia sp. PCC 7116]|uniref:ATP-binding protein n=1 Tax=Rivularia sp. PCC 7116 TaxID=373994 RepID=UPI00029EF88F|nr:ATP-binding protein [Rivularia sp. PCC 7116]AFY55276.1 NB-ARC domain-containing protein [Rivularia sp. PCC 7116]
MDLSKIALLLFKAVLQEAKNSHRASESGYSIYNLLFWIIAEKIAESQLEAILHDLIDLANRDLEKENQSSNTIQQYYAEKISVEKKDIHSTLQNLITIYNYQELIKNQNTAKLDKFKSIYHNLPARDCNGFVGRSTEIKELLELLSFESLTPRISIEGLGGVGKTTLVLDIAYRYLQAGKNSHSPFEAIVFTSAKPQHFTNKDIFPQLLRQRTLQDILRAIARTIKCPDTVTTNFKETYEQVYSRLANMPTLLIVDNLDALEHEQEVINFLSELPATVKVIITSRETTPFTRICLHPLTQTEGLTLIQNQATEKNVELTLKESRQLYQATGGIPAAIVYAVGQLAFGYRFADVCPQMMNHQGDFSRFYFDNSIQTLKGDSSHLILMALALFPKATMFESICSVVGIKDNHQALDALAKLQQLSLVTCHRGYYNILPLTREYALSELVANPEFASLVRKRWVNWYLDFAQKYGGKYEKEWNEYHELEAEWENICEVMEWCIAKDEYANAYILWQHINCYTYSQGYRRNRLHYWDTPLHWLEWLIEAAQKRQDLSNAARMMSDYAWKLILIGQPQHLNQADSLLAESWKLRLHLTASEQANLAIHILVWYIQLKQFGFATFWINQVETILDDSYIEDSVSIRISLQLLYYKGEIYYKNGDYQRSQLLFQEIVEQSRNIGWQRMIFLAKDFLADISIKQGKLQQAQQFLMEGMQTAQENRDSCSRAYMMRSLARLELHQGNLYLALSWANQAKASFNSLGMLSEAEETQSLLAFGNS